MLRRAAERRGTEPIYRFLVSGESDGPQETLSACELEADARKIGGALRTLARRAVDSRPRVIISCNSPIDFARAFFGAIGAGALPVPADPPLLRSGAEGLQILRGIVVDARPSLLIGDVQSIDVIRKIAPEFEQEDSGCPLLTIGKLIEMGDDQDPVDLSPDDTAFLQYTSGSISSPRGILVSHANLSSNLRAIEKALARPPGAIGVSWLPLSHDLGLIGNLLQALYVGSGELVLLTPSAFAVRPVRWLQAISRFRAWGTSAPNFAFALCNRVVKRAQVEELDFSCLESVLCGAEPIDATTLQRFARRFAPQGFRSDRVRPCYGLAEATLFVSMAAPRSFRVKTFDAAALSQGRLEESVSKLGRCIVSCGVVQNELEIAIVDPATGRQLSEHEVGEIWISGASVAKGYFGWPDERNEATLRATLDGHNVKYLRTGDLGASYEAELYVIGRHKDVVVMHGRNYDAHDLESIAATAHPRLRAGHIAAFSDFEQGESVVVLAEAASIEEENEYRTIARRIRARLGETLGIQPSKIVIAPAKSIALTSTGKIRRSETGRRYKSGSIRPLFEDAFAAEPAHNSFTPPHDRSAAEVIELALLREIRIAARLGEQEPLSPDFRLSQLGIDSLGVAQLAMVMGEFMNSEAASAILNDDPTLPLLISRVRGSGGVQDLDFPRPVQESADVFEPAHRFNLPHLMKVTGLNPFYHAFSDWEGTHARLDGRRILILSSFDYLGLSNNPRVREAAARAARENGTGRSSSRVHSGTTPEILAMEDKLARFLNRQDAVVCTTGYQAMAGIVTALMNNRTTLVVDQDVHASILDGAAISGCRVVRFRHNDHAELNEILESAKSAMVMVEGLYSNGGDISPLPEIREICSRHRVRLALDEAHALGVLGATGRGTEEHYGCIGASDIIAGTFSKSLVSVGGWIAGDHDVMEYIRYHSRPLLFTAGLAPPMLAAASAALDLLLEQPELTIRLRQNAECFLQQLRRCSVPVGEQPGPIFRLPVGDDALCVRLSNELMRRGIYVHTVLYPSVARDSAMIRLCVSAAHDPSELLWAAQELGDACHSVLASSARAKVIAATD
jgi:7-keto-8-aminopelargonate synthetase-like enzyme/acyl-CoA synthetase (AMP-forming)/AMP-acid ligase II